MRVVDVLEQGIADGTHIGAQLYVSSRRAFGHGGHQSSVAFCDPEHGVVAVVCDGMPGRERHSARLDAISSAVYVDLGIAHADDPGRAKPFPTLGL